jgi:L-lactate permease
MRPDDVTMLVQLGLIVGAVLLWDAWLYLRGGYDATISATVTRTGRKYPWFALAVGGVGLFLFWHWFC